MDSSTTMTKKMLVAAAATTMAVSSTCEAFSMVAPPIALSLSRATNSWKTALHHPQPEEATMPLTMTETTTLAQEVIETHGTPLFLADPTNVPKFPDDEEEEEAQLRKKQSMKEAVKDKKARKERRNKKPAFVNTAKREEITVPKPASSTTTTTITRDTHGNANAAKTSALLREVAEFVVQEFDNQQVAKGRVLMLGSQSGQTMEDITFAQDSLQDLWKVAGEAVVDLGLFDQAPGLSVLDLNGAVSILDDDVN